MEASNLPTLHKFIDNGWQLRNEMAKAISRCEVYAKKGSVVPASAAKLTALFQAGIDAVAAVGNLPASIDLTAADTALSLAGDTSEQLVVTATQLDGGSQVVTGSSTYSSSNPAVATVSASGLVTAVAVGSATITAQYQNRVDTLAFTVAV